MTINTAHQGRHIPNRTLAAAFAGAVLAAGAGFGVAGLVLDAEPLRPVPSAPLDTGINDIDRYPGFDPNGFAGTDRENRALMHLRR